MGRPLSPRCHASASFVALLGGVCFVPCWIYSTSLFDPNPKEKVLDTSEELAVLVARSEGKDRETAEETRRRTTLKNRKIARLRKKLG